MIGILGGMGTQAGLDFCNKIAVLIEESQINTIQNLFFIINQTHQEDLKI